MGLIKLTVATLADVDDGRLALAIEKQLKRCIDDCRDRCGLDATRKVTIELAITPVVDDVNDLTHCSVDYQVKTGLPALKREGLSFAVQKNSDLLFSKNSPLNVDQRTLMDNDD